MSAEAPQPAPAFNRTQVDLAFNRGLVSTRSLENNVTAVKENLIILADTLPGLGREDQLPGLKAELEKIVKLHAELEAHQRAMQAVQAGYQHQASEPATDFKAAIQQHMDGDEQLQSFSAEAHPWMRELEESMGGNWEHKEQDLGEDDDMVMQDTQFLTNNCPLTMRPLLELKEPVEDSLGYVYEKEAILEHIRRTPRGARAECPVSGTRHFIAAADMKPSRKVMREQRKVRMGGTSVLQAPRQQHDDAEVLDAD